MDRLRIDRHHKRAVYSYLASVSRSGLSLSSPCFFILLIYPVNFLYSCFIISSHLAVCLSCCLFSRFCFYFCVYFFYSHCPLFSLCSSVILFLPSFLLPSLFHFFPSCFLSLPLLHIFPSISSFLSLSPSQSLDYPLYFFPHPTVCAVRNVTLEAVISHRLWNCWFLFFLSMSGTYLLSLRQSFTH